MNDMPALLKVALRQQAIFIPDIQTPATHTPQNGDTMNFVAELMLLGYTVTEELLSALAQTPVHIKALILANLREAKGADKNWTPLVKNWQIPTNESSADHIMTFFANLFNQDATATLPCGHYIPKDTFPLDRYNGCPYCGTPFEFESLELKNQGSQKVVLVYWNEKNIQQLYHNLLLSKTALDATQVDSLKILMSIYPLPDIKPAMKETLMLVIDTLVERNEAAKAQPLLTSPNEILRYLWYKHTGFLQIILPKTIIKRQSNNNQHLRIQLDESAATRIHTKASLKLKYSRKTGRMVANWLSNMEMPIEKMCEDMHPKRGMWVRFIRALRLSDYTLKAGCSKLLYLLNAFYREEYTVHAGHVQQYRLRKDATHTLKLLQERPGLFARSLFANMVWFGPEKTLPAFAEVMDKVPARLVFTLAMYAEIYFDKEAKRTVKPLGGVAKMIPGNKWLHLFSDQELQEMKESVQDLTLELMKKRFASVENTSKSIYIDPILFKMPLAIGDRSETIQDLPSALQGTRFPVQGDKVRLFMQWGEGLPAQHLDMDLSCWVAYDDRAVICSFSNLSPKGCNHSGDIRSIPDQVGTAEYIDINIPALQKDGARYVIFISNAYSNGTITPNLVVGWMNSEFKMSISEKGVAYDPSCVQHQVRIGSGLTKGLVFGVLDIHTHEIIWLEMPYQGQIAGQLNTKAVETLLRKLDSKLSIGNFLRIKASAQALTEVPDESLADEVYSVGWARDAAAVTQLFVD